ncbi:hypothetical protein [Nocardia sp. NPDC056000]|uniref:hypothetical protein n=1 Tax=Nocardia sp. NPDC056000 TaxID=3345674 RepID=UPI0035D667C3
MASREYLTIVSLGDHDPEVRIQGLLVAATANLRRRIVGYIAVSYSVGIPTVCWL